MNHHKIVVLFINKLHIETLGLAAQINIITVNNYVKSPLEYIKRHP